MGASAQTSQDRGPAYAWMIVLAAFLCFGIIYGTVIYSFTVFVNPVAKAFAVSPTKVVFGFTLVNIGSGILGVLAGRVLARFPIRNVIVAGLILLAGGFVTLSMVTALWQFYLVYATIVAFASILVAPLGASAIVTNWFATSRGRALTMATLGTSFGQLLIPPFAAQMMELGGWPMAYKAFAGLLLVIALPLAFLVVDRPEDRGQRPYGADFAPPEVTTNGVRLSNREILARRDFWVIAASYLLTVLVYLALVATIVPYARTFGVSALQASKLAGCMGIFAIIGKLGFAAWTDRMGLRNTFWIAIGLNLIALVLLSMVHSYPVLFVASACIGGSAGGVLPVWPGLVGFRFGRQALPQVMGLMSPLVLSLQGFGAPLVTGLNYRPAFLIFIVLLLISAVLSRNLSRPNAPSPV
jgi:MFS family permease